MLADSNPHPEVVQWWFQPLFVQTRRTAAETAHTQAEAALGSL